MNLVDIKLGIYEKALPKNTSWETKYSIASSLGFNFIEMSIDETDERLTRLEWSAEKRRDFRKTLEKSNISIPSICLSGHRRFPLGSHDPDIRAKAREMMKNAIGLAIDLGIRTIQLAGYDVYYEEQDNDTQQWFIEGLRDALKMAARENVMLAMEIMDTKYLSSITRFMNLKKKLNSPWFTVYPDIGNLTAWGNDVEQELELGINHIVAMHLKDTKKVTGDYPGQFKEVPFGEGCVDFTEAFRILKKLNYTGPFLIEMWTEKADDPVREIANAKNWLIDHMKKGGFIDG